MPDASTRRLLLSQARELLAQALGFSPQRFRVLLLAAGARIALVPRRGELPTADAVDGLSESLQAILDVCDNEPRKANAIARRCGRSCNSHFRGQLAELVEMDLIDNDGAGYRLTTRRQASD